jgi:hypothetical protein
VLLYQYSILPIVRFIVSMICHNSKLVERTCVSACSETTNNFVDLFSVDLFLSIFFVWFQLLYHRVIVIGFPLYRV